MTSGIYRITNLVNNKIYIGSGSNIEKRWRRHTSDLNLNRHQNRHLQRAWSLHSNVNFSFKIIEIVRDCSKLIEREQHWIDKTKCYEYDIGYNLCRFVASTRGVKFSEESRKLISKLRTGKKHTEEHKRKIGLKSTGRFHTEETKAKMRLIKTGKTHTAEARLKISAAAKKQWMAIKGYVIIDEDVSLKDWNATK